MQNVPDNLLALERLERKLNEIQMGLGSLSQANRQAFEKAARKAAIAEFSGILANHIGSKGVPLEINDVWWLAGQME